MAEMGSGNERGLPAAQQDTRQHSPARRQRYHRHTSQQIQEMESFFKGCPRPNKTQRIEISKDLGLEESQVKYWFQNHHTQMKTYEDRNENARLKTENNNLKRDIQKHQKELNNLTCAKCSSAPKHRSFEIQQLCCENIKMKEEYERVWATVSRIVGPSLEHTFGMSRSPVMSNNLYKFSGESGHVQIMGEEKTIAMQLALSSLDEIRKMCLEVEPLWVRRHDGKEVLNIEEYDGRFPWGMSSLIRQLSNQQYLRTKASRETAFVLMNSITLVDAFIDGDKWADMFPSMVLKAKKLQTIEAPSGNFKGSLHLMQAEIQMLSPLVATKELLFIRYCCQDVEGTWAIVDFPLDSIKDMSYASPFPTYKRRPSGCFIQEMANGYSKVTWVEHVEVEDKPVHPFFNQFGGCVMAFGAEKWLAVLQRQCQRISRLMSQNISDPEVISSPEAKTNLMNLAKRMMRMFCVGLSSSSRQSWIALSDSLEDTVRLSTGSATEPGHPIGLILSVASTTWLPYSHHQVFDLLRDERRIAQMQVPSSGNSFHKVAHIANGPHPGNCISLHLIDGASRSSQVMEFILQESYTDESESVVAYTTLDSNDVEEVMYGTDTSIIPVLPCGFVMVPMNQSSSNTAQVFSTRDLQQDTGCLLTVGLQVLASTDPYAKINLSSVFAMKDQLHNIIHQINMAFSGASTSGRLI